MNSLIDGKPTQNKLKKFQEQKKVESTGILSKRYWSQFIKRNKEILDVTRCYCVASCRTEWVTHTNLKRIYDMVYTQVVKAGVAKWLPPSQHYFVDEEGERTESENDAVGLKINNSP